MTGYKNKDEAFPDELKVIVGFCSRRCVNWNLLMDTKLLCGNE